MEDNRLLNEIKGLDGLLGFLYQDRGHSSLEDITKRMKISGDITSNRLITLTTQLYAHEPTNGNYAITAQGRIFWLKGGYEKQYERDKATEQIQASQIFLNQKQVEINEKNLDLTERVVWANMVIALGTSIAGIYYLLQLRDGEHLKSYPSIILPIIGICIVSIGILAVWNILQRKK